MGRRGISFEVALGKSSCVAQVEVDRKENIIDDGSLVLVCGPKKTSETF